VRILHIGKFFYPYQGGIENFLRDFATISSDEGISVSILAHQERPFQPTRTESMHGFEVTRTFTFGQAVYTPLAPSFPYHLLRKVGDFKPDILHLHLPNPSAFWVLLLRLKMPCVVHWHSDVVVTDTDKSLAFFYPFYQWFEMKLLRQARAIIATSEDYLTNSKTLHPFRDKCHVIPMGLNPCRIYTPTTQEITDVKGKFGQQPMVLSVGRFTQYKGFQLLIEAAHEVPEARFVIVGDGTLREPMIKKVKQLGLEGRVFLPGHLSERELHTMMAACDVFCLPSVERSEAFGLVLLEAMAFGKPLITIDVKGSGLSWVNQHGRTGLVVAEADPGKLAQVIKTLLSNANLRHEMGCNGNERMKRLFHIRNVAKEIFLIYSTLHAPPFEAK
jgi:glycosyltransferase involved in cell wall biosynthesis